MGDQLAGRQGDARLSELLLYGGVFGIALAYWAVTTVNRMLPATTTSLGLLGVPVLGMICSALALGEAVGAALLGAMGLILGGILVGTLGRINPTRPDR